MDKSIFPPQPFHTHTSSLLKEIFEHLMDELQIKMDLVKQAKGRTSHQQSTTFLSRTQLSLLCPQKRITQSKVHFASYCVLSPKANSKPLLLAYFQKSDAVDKVDLWVQTGVERKNVSKPWTARKIMTMSLHIWTPRAHFFCDSVMSITLQTHVVQENKWFYL